MQSVTLFPTNIVRHLGVVLAAAVLIAAAGASFASFQAASPGSDLSPLSGAETVIDLIQGHETILWSALSGTVANVRTEGWPSSDGTHELGGALMLEAPENQLVGIVNFGEKPMSMTFQISD
jgi:hypothetical protein